MERRASNAGAPLTVPSRRRQCFHTSQETGAIATTPVTECTITEYWE